MPRSWAFWGLVLSFTGAVGCGGSSKQAPATPATAETEVSPSGGDDVMATPESYDDVRAAFRQREMQVGRCFADAAQRGTIDPKDGGRVTVALQVTTAGEPKNVRIASISLDSPELSDCIVKLVSSWSLPPPNVLIDFSYTYSFLSE